MGYREPDIYRFPYGAGQLFWQSLRQNIEKEGNRENSGILHGLFIHVVETLSACYWQDGISVTTIEFENGVRRYIVVPQINSDSPEVDPPSVNITIEDTGALKILVHNSDTKASFVFFYVPLKNDNFFFSIKTARVPYYEEIIKSGNVRTKVTLPNASPTELERIILEDISAMLAFAS